MIELEKAKTLEEVGIDSNLVYEFVSKLDELGVENHSILLIKDDKIAIENYTFPYSENYAHSMFSVSKGFISTAVGFCISEGKMKLDAPILDYYPGYAKYKEDKRYEKVTVEALLTMHSGKKSAFIKNMTKGEYADDFIKARFRGDDRFVYSNDDVYMLSKAVTKVTGQSVVDYLMPRLFAPLNIDKPFWELTYSGVEVGSTGLYLKTEDLAKVCYCYLNNGKYFGKQIIPESWVKAASAYHVKLPMYYRDSKDYGYYFWGDPHGGYRFDGMYGQFGIVFPKHNAILVLTNNTCRELDVIEQIFKYFPKAFEASNNKTTNENLNKRFKDNIKNNLLVTQRSFAKEKITKDVIYRMPFYKVIDPIGFPLSIIPMSVNTAFPRKAKQSMDKFKFNFKELGFDMTWNEGREQNTIYVSMDGKLVESKMKLGTFEYKVLANAWWEKNTLNVIIRSIETPCRRILKIRFGKCGLTMKIDSNPSLEGFIFAHIDEVEKPKPIIIDKIEKGILKFGLKFSRPTLLARASKH